MLKKISESRKDLLDLGLRNPLINYNNKSSKVDVVDELSSEIFKLLVEQKKELQFIPNLKAPEVHKDSDDINWESLFADPREKVEVTGIAARHADNKLQTKLIPEKLITTLLKIHNNARSFIEEQGINTLYLALGFLHWFESDASEIDRKAPLVLIPVELKRDNVKDRFKLSYTDEDISENLSLLQKLKNDFGIPFPVIDEAEDFKIERYFSKVENSIKKKEKWFVNRNEIILGFFSFGKYLMYKDLEEELWPKENKPSEHPILLSLLKDGFRNEGSIIPDDCKIDKYINPVECYHILDADSSQIKAILEVNAEKNLIIQGPPGTGKSQTIANIIAESMGKGKRILFVAEKMAALEVVKRRLDKVGLGESILELHSHKINKHYILNDLNNTLELKKPELDKSGHYVDTYITLRDKLNQYVEAVNTNILNSGVTLIEALGSLIKLGDETEGLPKFDFKIMRDWSRSTYFEKRILVEELEQRLMTIGVPIDNPFWGTARTTLMPTEETQIRKILSEAISAIKELRQEGFKLTSYLKLDEPKSPTDIESAARAALRAIEAPHLKGITLNNSEWQLKRDDLNKLIASGIKMNTILKDNSNVLIPDAWDKDVYEIRQDFMVYGNKWWKIFSSKYRKSRSNFLGVCKTNIPKQNSDCIKLLDSILEFQKTKHVYKKYELLGSNLFGTQWQNAESDWIVLSKISEWVIKLYDDVGAGIIPQGIISFISGDPSLNNIKEQVDRCISLITEYVTIITSVYNHLEIINKPTDSQGIKNLTIGIIYDQIVKWLDNLSMYKNLVVYNLICKKFEHAGLQEVTKIAEKWPLASTALVKAFDASWYLGLLESAFQKYPVLNEFDRNEHEFSIEKFKKLDRELLKYNRSRLALEHWNKLPHLDQGGELNILKRELHKKRRHLPIRKLMDEAGRAIQAIKPVFMMSPMSVAKFLPPGKLNFDLVIFDEASQVKPVDAFGAIIRGRQAVVVGDEKQLPPTTFFESVTTGDEEEADENNVTTDMESILGLFNSQNAPNRMLSWHYRSRHESLIAISNLQFYNNKLMIFPSAGNNADARGLVFHYLPQTSYDAGKTRTNMDEALLVAEAVMKHANERAHLTLGVVAFSVAQRDAIEMQLEKLRLKNPTLEKYFNENLHEPFFIKNLENVQGDERDVIFISVGYGKTQNGYFPMRFGPLNRQGGERRLNVLITRARYCTEVFSNFRSDDLDTSKTNSEGVKALKHYLRYAENRSLDFNYTTSGDLESLLEEQVFSALQRAGYNVEAQVGCAGFRIDIGVRDNKNPEHFILGIECDGASYHSALSARDRDRLRQEILESLGWRIYRIWSVDWFRNPKKELQKLIERIELEKNNLPSTKSISEDGEFEIVRNGVGKQEFDSLLKFEAYRKAQFNIHYHVNNFSDLALNDIILHITKIVKTESPVHMRILMTRLTENAGISRIGPRIQQTIQEAVDVCVKRRKFRMSNDFIYDPEREEIIPRDRSLLENSFRSIEFVAPEEVYTAFEIIIKNSFSITMDELFVSLSDKLGIKRLSEDIKIQLEKELKRIIKNSEYQYKDGKIYPKQNV